MTTDQPHDPDYPDVDPATGDEAETFEPAADVTHQPTIPDLELPEYHGRQPIGMRTSLLGAGSRITRPHTIGDRIVLVIEARMKADGHDETDDGLVYSEKHKVLDLFELAGDQGARLLSTLRSLYRTGEDAVKGKRPIPELGEVGYTDSSGIALLPEEVAELRGDPIRAVLAPELTPAVIVYDDGERDLWPDDYPRDTPRPRVGERFSTGPRDVGAIVERLLHHETGEDLDEPVDVTMGSPSPGFDHLDELEAELSEALAEEALTGAAVPDLPDAFSGDLGDDVPGWETPDPATADRLTKAEREENARVEALLPTTADFDFVAAGLKDLRPKLAEVDDLAQARRLEVAEKQGRGTGRKPRVAALTMIRARIAELEAAD